jgi:DNA-binding transcriptional ArsR family regulator
MTASRVDLIMHPVRMRLLATLARRHLTARQLSALLPDVPQATLYHHLGLLTRAELLRIASERQVRGTVEKVYALANDDATLGHVDLANASREDHLRYFAIFMATVLSDFTRYLQKDEPIDLYADGVSYNIAPLYLTEDEFARAATAVNQALLPLLDNQPSPGRRRRLFVMATFPDAGPADEGPVDAQEK